MTTQSNLKNQTPGPDEARVLQISNRPADDLHKINIDELLETEVKATGFWQWYVCLLIMFSTSSLTTFEVFANSASAHRCQMEPEVELFIQNKSLTFEQAASFIGPWTNLADVKNQGGSKILLKGCYRYDLDWQGHNLTQMLLLTRKNKAQLMNARTEPCPYGFVFDDSPFNYPGNVVREFETLCNKSWLVPFGTSVYMFGMMIGFLFGGWLGDRFGRKNTIIFVSLIELLTGIWTSLSLNYTSYIIGRALMAVGSTGKVSVGSVLVMELTLARYRSLFTAALGLGINFLYRALVAFYAYLIPEWRYLNLAIMTPNLLSILYFWFIPESPRWLVAKRNPIRALLVLQSGYRTNHCFEKVKQSERINALLDYYLMKYEQEQEQDRITPPVKKPFDLKTFFKNLSFVKPFATRQLTKVTTLGSIFVFGIVMCFFGLILYARVVWNYVYLVSFLNSLTAIPSVVLSILLYRYVRNRRRPLLGVLLLSSIILGSCSIYTVVAKPETDIILTVFSNMGMILVNSSLTMCYVYVPELFPSEIRTMGFGTILGLARFGSMACTFINELDRIVAHGFPLIIYSVVLMIECLVLCGLSDTSGENLPDLIGQTIENSSEQV